MLRPPWASWGFQGPAGTCLGCLRLPGASWGFLECLGTHHLNPIRTNENLKLAIRAASEDHPLLLDHERSKEECTSPVDETRLDSAIEAQLQSAITDLADITAAGRWKSRAFLNYLHADEDPTARRPRPAPSTSGKDEPAEIYNIRWASRRVIRTEDRSPTEDGDPELRRLAKTQRRTIMTELNDLQQRTKPSIPEDKVKRIFSTGPQQDYLRELHLESRSHRIKSGPPTQRWVTSARPDIDASRCDAWIRRQRSRNNH